jgi:dipeptidyl aminopeptidase/acylaminoacyl peptidase
MRGQSLAITVNGTEYTTPISEGRHCDAFDQGADDAIAFLNIIEATEQKADASRVAVRGGSRGGTVALLMGERDERVKMAVAIVGPTDMLGLTSQNVNDLTYQCQFLEGLVQKTETLNTARLNMIASSPIFFADRLPKTQVHFAEDDQIVPLSQGVELRTRMTEIGLQDRFEMFVYEGKDHSNIAVDNKEMNDRIEELFSQL